MFHLGGREGLSLCKYSTVGTYCSSSLESRVDWEYTVTIQERKSIWQTNMVSKYSWRSPLSMNWYPVYFRIAVSQSIVTEEDLQGSVVQPRALIGALSFLQRNSVHWMSRNGAYVVMGGQALSYLSNHWSFADTTEFFVAIVTVSFEEWTCVNGFYTSRYYK